MYEDFLLNNNKEDESLLENQSLTDLDSLFDNLSNDINNFNKYINTINQKNKENIEEEQSLLDEKLKIDKAKLEFESYVKTKNLEYESKMKQIDEYLNTQKQILLKSETEFKASMDNSLNELELEKREFETYKNLELNRIKHSQEILESEKNQFEKYKDVNMKKIELENKTLEQKCDRLKEMVNQFNSNFKPMMEQE